MNVWLKAVSESEGFEWDRGNVEKSEEKHQVSCEEAEQAFINRPMFLVDDPRHSQMEIRIKAFGQTDEGRLLTVSFTMRNHKIRVISARNMNQKERKSYEAQR